ncbi:MFS transporter [Streptomyces harbinensis]|uniref:MFS transporter n=1 Tax=Streptomyces harbinensis TaxID=1176198 RepID=UPI0037203966
MREELTVLGQRPFRRLFLSRALQLLGSSLAPIALAFAVLAMPGGSATTLGLVLFARSAAQVLLLLFGGVIADRLPRARVMVIANVLAFVSQAGMALVLAAQTGGVPALCALATLNGASTALFLPAAAGILPQVVTRDRLQAANALIRLSRSAATVGGAGLAGVLVSAFGADRALAVSAVLFALSTLSLRGVVTRAPAARTSAPGMLTDLRDGWREFTSRRWIWQVVLQFSVLNACFNGGIYVLGPVVADDRLGGAAAWSVIVTAQAVGFVAGGLVAMRIRPRFPMRTATLATFGFVPPFLLLALGAPVWLIALSTLVNGVCADIFEVLWSTELQQHVPQEALSRVSSYDALGSFVLGPLGLALVGPVSAVVGVERTLAACAVLALLVNTATLLSRSVRDLPARPAAPDPAPASAPAPSGEARSA